MSDDRQAIRYYTKGDRSHVTHGLLVRTTPSKVHVVLMEPGIRVQKLPRAEERYMVPLDLPPGRVAKHLRQAARQWGDSLSRETKQALRGA